MNSISVVKIATFVLIVAILFILSVWIFKNLDAIQKPDVPEAAFQKNYTGDSVFKKISNLETQISKLDSKFSNLNSELKTNITNYRQKITGNITEKLETKIANLESKFQKNFTDYQKTIVGNITENCEGIKNSVSKQYDDIAKNIILQHEKTNSMFSQANESFEKNITKQHERMNNTLNGQYRNEVETLTKIQKNQEEQATKLSSIDGLKNILESVEKNITKQHEKMNNSFSTQHKNENETLANIQKSQKEQETLLRSLAGLRNVLETIVKENNQTIKEIKTNDTEGKNFIVSQMQKNQSQIELAIKRLDERNKTRNSELLSSTSERLKGAQDILANIDSLTRGIDTKMIKGNMVDIYPLLEQVACFSQSLQLIIDILNKRTN